MLELPDLPAGFTPDVLTELLRNQQILPASAEVSFVTRHQVGDGTGMMSEVARLVIEYRGESDGLRQALSPNMHPRMRPIAA